MPAMLQDESAAAVIRAIEANDAAFYAHFAKLPYAGLHRSPALTWLVTGSPVALFNGVIRTQLTTPDIDAQIAAILTVFQQRKVPFLWHLGPSTQPADLGKHLQAYGLTHVDDGTGMVVELGALNEPIATPPTLTIHPVTTLEVLQQWVAIFVQRHSQGIQPCFDVYAGLGLGPQEPLRHFLGCLDGEPVATSSVFIGAGVVSVQHVVTLPEVRRQGIGTAMTLAALRAARNEGYRIGVLISASMAVNVYERLGFRDYCRLSLYAWPGEQPEQAADPRSA